MQINKNMPINESRNSANNGAQSVTPEGVVPGGTQLNNQFMTLLVAQIQNQDPLNPTDGTEFISQMAQLSQVQSTENMAKLLSHNSLQMEKMQTMATANLVGQKVMVEIDRVELDKTGVEGNLTLAHPTSTLTIYLTDEDGKEYSISLGEQPAGVVNFTLDPASARLKPGQYRLSAVSGSGEEQIPLTLAGTVNHVRIPPQGGTPKLNISGLGDVSYDQVTQFGTASKRPASI